MATALVLVWILITIQVLTIAACATLLARSHRRDVSLPARSLSTHSPPTWILPPLQASGAACAMTDMARAKASPIKS